MNLDIEYWTLIKKSSLQGPDPKFVLNRFGLVWRTTSYHFCYKKKSELGHIHEPRKFPLREILEHDDKHKESEEWRLEYRIRIFKQIFSIILGQQEIFHLKDKERLRHLIKTHELIKVDHLYSEVDLVIDAIDTDKLQLSLGVHKL